MTNRTEILESRSRVSRRGGFTLVELLVVIGIALVLMGIVLPAVNRAYNQGVRTRMAADLQSIATALEAYRQDHGDIPRVYGTGTTPSQTGSVVLCRALIAPGPATGTGADGKDGFGFRTRTAIGTTVQGKAYGPYLEPDKFKLDSNAANPKILDRNGKEILYFPGFKSAQLTSAQGYIWNASYTLSAAGVRPMFNTNDNNMALLDSHAASPAVAAGRTKFLFIMGAKTDGSAGPSPAYTGDYLLWSAGPDELYGMPSAAALTPANKCDDVANFSRSAF